MRYFDLKGNCIELNIDLKRSVRIIKSIMPTENGYRIVIVHPKAATGMIACDVTETYGTEVIAAAKQAIRARKNPADRVEYWECMTPTESVDHVRNPDGKTFTEVPNGKTAWAWSLRLEQQILKNRMSPQEWEKYERGEL